MTNLLATINDSAHADTCFDLLHEMFNAPDYMLQRMIDHNERPAMVVLVDAGIAVVCPDRGQHHLTDDAAVAYRDSLADLSEDDFND